MHTGVNLLFVITYSYALDKLTTLIFQNDEDVNKQEVQYLLGHH